MKVISMECGGIAAAVRISVNVLNDALYKANDKSEESLFRYYFSFYVTDSFSRCFTTQPGDVNLALRPVLTAMLTSAVGTAEFGEDHKDSLEQLMKSGVVVIVSAVVEFASPLAARFVTRLLYPRRAPPSSLPSSLCSLVVQAIGHMSASALQHSVASALDTPKEAVYQQMMLQGLHYFTPPNCSVCPELSRVFGEPHSTPRIAGEVDFFINGELRWGLELLVNGGGIGERLQRFAPNGKYAPLNVKDYVVVDLRVGPVTNIIRSSKRMTVFFASDFTSCIIIHGGGEQEVQWNIQLSH